ncbi:zinc-binding protein A33-like [Labeo rohita]|uniref:zinc-binding protein A33-like n=1 Tax=Labeo rohita TaxID=84645 RepID=UPI0021E204BE|nr:zinc-binding protein A33-like [Labeo rohita]
MTSSSALLTEELQCSICLDVFTDPVSTPCGHNFCKNCLSQCWDNSQTCKCPYCKETFNHRPDLKINMTLRMVVDYFKMKELKRRQQYAVDVTLDPDTANPYLILSDGGKQVRHGDIKQKLPNNPERFDYYVSVLGKQGFSSGRFYFEVQVKGKTAWALGVARESTKRKGDIILNPRNGYWTVWLFYWNEYAAFSGRPVPLSLRVKPQRIGVFVDYEEGLVSFYDAETSSHIYSFTGQSFTEKLYPYFSPSFGYNGTNVTPLIITPVSCKK